MQTKCNIVTDSCCDFTPEDLAALNIDYLSFSYAEADRPEDGLNGIDDLFQSRSAREFYDAIEAGAHPSTSQPSQLEYEKAYSKVMETGVPTVFFTLSSGISGAYDGALAALAHFEETHPKAGELIYIVDTLIGSTTQNLFIHEAARQRDMGCTAEELVAWAEDARFNTRTIFMVENLDALHRGGRVPKSVAVVGGLLDVKPLLTWDLKGALAVISVGRGRKKALRQLKEFYERVHDDDVCGATVAIGDADCPEDGDWLAAELKAEYPGITVYRSTIGPTIGTHVGRGMVSCCCWGADRRTNGNDDSKR